MSIQRQHRLFIRRRHKERKERVSVHIDGEVADRARSIAAADGRSLSSYINRLVEDADRAEQQAELLRSAYRPNGAPELAEPAEIR
jgi:hypothetical protein